MQGMPRTDLCPFDASWSHWSWWSLHEKSHKTLPSTSLCRHSPSLSVPLYLPQLQPARHRQNYPEGQAESRVKEETGKACRYLGGPLGCPLVRESETQGLGLLPTPQGGPEQSQAKSLKPAPIPEAQAQPHASQTESTESFLQELFTKCLLALSTGLGAMK